MRLNTISLIALAMLSLTACGGGGGGGSYSGGYDDTCDDFFDDCGGNSDGYDDGYDDGGSSGDDGWDDGYDDGGDDGWDDGYDDGGDDGTHCDPSGFCYNLGNPNAGRDVVGHLASSEVKRIETAGKTFAAKYHLSAATGQNVAKAFYDWRAVSKTRTRTVKDLQAFTKRLYGVEFSRVTMAVGEASKGNLAPLEDAVEDAADHWGTTPETMKEILKDFYKNQLAGVKK